MDAQLSGEQRQKLISGHLSEAIRLGEVQVYFQPQYRYDTRRLRGAEALCRWNHAELGWILPAEFIPVLESTGQVEELDKYVWEQVARHLHKWNRMGKKLVLSVNVSRVDLLGGDVPEIFAGLLQKYELDPAGIHLEITESAYIDRPEFLIREVTRLNDAGFVVEVDDFGNGVSSLNMLEEVPVDVLKMDLHFLKNPGGKSRGGKIMRHVIDMANDMNMEVVAERVERPEQAEFLQMCDCQTMQGFLLSLPLPADEFENLLRQTDVCEAGEAEQRESESKNYMWQLLEENKELQRRLSLIPGAIFCYEAEDEQRFSYISPSMVEMLKYESEDALREHFGNSFRNFVWREDAARVRRQIEHQVQIDNTDYCEYRVECGDGTLMWVYDRGRRIEDADGKKWFYVVISNMDETKRHEQEVKRQELRLRIMARIPGMITFDLDLNADVMTEDVGLGGEHVRQRMYENFTAGGCAGSWCAPEDRARLLELISRLKLDGGNGHIDVKGDPLGKGEGWYRISYTCLRDRRGEVDHIMGRVENIDSYVRTTNELEDQARRDSMTRLLNHEALLDGIANCLKKQGGTLIMFDIDNFKDVNDRNSHSYGDSVLIKVAETLEKSFRRSDLVGRYGGDEFTVFMPGACSREFALSKTQKVLCELNAMKVKNVERFSVSAGISIAENGDGITVRELVDMADGAMYEIKRSGKNSVRLAEKK